jgi:hypothetical protein
MFPLKCLLLFTVLFITGQSAFSQLDYNAVKFDYKSVNPSFDGVIRKLTKTERVYAKYNYNFQFNYPAEIETAAGGYLYKGNMFCKWVNTPGETDSISMQINFGSVKVIRTVRDEPVRLSLDVNGYLRHYQVAYPATIFIYKKNELVRKVSFFTDDSPLTFTFSKEMVDKTINTYNVGFASINEINDNEKAGKVNKAAEKFAYFAAMQKAHEVIKNLYGDYNYELEIGYMTIKQKKASADYSDIIGSASTLEQAITAFKKKNMVLSDSLIRKAKREFETYTTLTDQRMVPVAKEVVNYNLMICYALLGETQKAAEMLKAHYQTNLQKAERFSGNSFGVFLDVLQLRNRLQNEQQILL